MFESEETESQGSESGLTAPFRRLLESASGFLASKLELLGIEFQEEKRRILELLILASAALLFSVLTLFVLTFAVIALFWDTHRVAAVVGVFLVYFLISAILFVRLKRKANTGTHMFDATVEELKKDTEWVKRHLH